MNAVTVKNLTKVFRQGDEDIYAVDHVSFTVAPGEMVAIVPAQFAMALPRMLDVFAVLPSAFVAHGFVGHFLRTLLVFPHAHIHEFGFGGVLFVVGLPPFRP